MIQWSSLITGDLGLLLHSVLSCAHAQSCLTLCNPLDYSPPGSFVHGIFSGKNNGVDCHFLLQEIFPTQRSNPRLLSLLYPWATWAVNWGGGMGSCCWAELKWMQINQNLPFKCSPGSCKSLIDSRTYSSYIRQILPGRICSRSGDGFLVPLTSSSQNLPFKLF